MKFRRTIATALIVLTMTGAVTGCDTKLGRTVQNQLGHSELEFEATTRFLYSIDGGHSWSETIQELPVGETYWLSIEMQVAQSEETRKEQVVVATVTIPATNVVDCQLDDHPGASVTGLYDEANNCTIYEFRIVADTTPNKFRVVFECEPLETGRTRFEVVYDDQVSEVWDATGVIKYVEDEEFDSDEPIETVDYDVNFEENNDD